MAITAFLSRSPGLLNRGPGSPASLGHGPHSIIFSSTDLKLWTPTAQSGVQRAPLCWVLVLSTASYLQLTRTPTDSNFLCTELYYCFTPTQFNLSIVKVIPWIPSTGCTCYLRRSISYFVSPAGVNMQHTKQSDGEVPVILDFWGMRSTSSLPSGPGSLWPGVVTPGVVTPDLWAK